MTRYRTIVADPPWPYPEGFAAPGANHLIGGRKRRPEERGPLTIKPLPYAAMSLTDISALPVDKLAQKDARIFLWATNRYLPDAFGIVGEWGFRFRQMVVWDKRPNVNPMTGSIAPNSAEFLLVAARGAPGRLTKWEHSIVQARKPRTEHSRKPDVFLDLVEQVSPGPYLELFARRQRLGWDTWGDEALEHVEMGA